VAHVSEVVLPEQIQNATPEAADRAPPRLAAWSDASFIVILAVLPFLLSGFWTYSIGVALANAIGILSVTVLVRFSGEVSIGHNFFMAAGAYTVAILEKRWGVPFYVSVFPAVFIGLLLGLVFAYPSRTLSGIYLAVATMALGLAVPEILLQWSSLTGGFEGLYVSGRLTTKLSKDLQQYYVALLVLVAAVYALKQLRHSRQGLALLTARYHPRAAEAFGVTVSWARLSVMGISAAIAGLAGGTLAFVSSTVSPNSFGFSMAIFLLVGSVASAYSLSLPAVVFGAALITLVPQYFATAGEWVPIFYGAALLLAILLRNAGGPALRWVASWVGARHG
jgi:branched-chain amino acid transport system permease protein